MDIQDYRPNLENKIAYEPMSGCWIWTGWCDRRGYGKMQIGRTHKTRKNFFAHRVSYMIYRGAIPNGLSICHHCDNPSCVNPDHLFAGTDEDNKADMLNKKRQAFGDRHSQAKLSKTVIPIIREAISVGYEQKDIATYFRVAKSTICHINKNKVWIHS